MYNRLISKPTTAIKASTDDLKAESVVSLHP